MASKRRIIYLDILRVIACSMVILMHSPAPKAGVPGYVQVPLYFLTAAGLVLFFMISGALLLPTQISVSSFLKHRIGKVIGPWFFWTFFYVIVELLQKNNSWSDLFQIFVYVSTPGRHIMWFMFTLIGLYLLSPIISPFIKTTSKKDIRIYLIIWILTLCTPWFERYLNLDFGISSTFYYFSGYVGYFVLGYYLHTFRVNISTMTLFILLILPLFSLIIFKFLGGEGLDPLFWYLSIFVAMMSVSWFEGVRRFSVFKNLESKFLTEVSNCSFGIYLVHIFIMRNLLWKIDFILYGLGWFGQIILSWILTFAISFLLIKAISYLPFAEYIVGYKHKKI